MSDSEANPIGQLIAGALVGAAVAAFIVYAAMDATRKGELVDAYEQGLAEARAECRLSSLTRKKSASTGGRSSPAWYCIDMGIGSGGCFPSWDECKADTSDESSYGSCVRIRNPRVACFTYRDIMADRDVTRCRYRLSSCEQSRGMKRHSKDYKLLTECEPTAHPDAMGSVDAGPPE